MGTYTFYDFTTAEVATGSTPGNSGYMYIDLDSNILSLADAAGGYAFAGAAGGNYFALDIKFNPTNRFAQ